MENVSIDHDLLLQIHKFRRHSVTAPAVKLLSRDNTNQELTEQMRQLYHIQDMLHQDSKGNRLEPIKMSTKGRYTPCPENSDALLPCTFNDHINIQDTAGCVSANNLIGATTEEVVKALLKQRTYRSICRRNAEKLKVERANVEMLLTQIKEEDETETEAEVQPETRQETPKTKTEPQVTEDIQPSTSTKESVDKSSTHSAGSEHKREMGAEPEGPSKKSDESDTDIQGLEADRSGTKRQEEDIQEEKVIRLQHKKIQEAIECELPLPIKVMLFDTAIPIVEETYKKYKKALGVKHSLTEEAAIRLKELKTKRSLYYD